MGRRIDWDKSKTRRRLKKANWTIRSRVRIKRAFSRKPQVTLRGQLQLQAIALLRQIIDKGLMIEEVDLNSISQMSKSKLRTTITKMQELLWIK